VINEVKRTLWENRKVRVWRAEGRLSDLVIDYVEPEGIDYNLFIGIGSHSYRRGTLYGNPSSFETYDDFYGSKRYRRVVVNGPDGAQLILNDVIVVKKFQNAFREGTDCSLYLISSKEPGEAIMVFAMGTNSESIADLEGIGSMIDRAMASFKRQAKIIAIPAVFSIGLFLVFTAVALGSLFGGVIWLAMGVIAFPIILFLFLGMLVIKSKLKVFPSRAVLADILVRDGFPVIDYSGVRDGSRIRVPRPSA
jgi:hypothetical protein